MDDEVPKHQPQNRSSSASKLRRSRKHCPVCLAPLEKKVADRSLAYFEAFYEAIEDPRTVQEAFLGTCLKP